MLGIYWIRVSTHESFLFEMTFNLLLKLIFYKNNLNPLLTQKFARSSTHISGQHAPKCWAGSCKFLGFRLSLYKMSFKIGHGGFPFLRCFTYYTAKREVIVYFEIIQWQNFSQQKAIMTLMDYKNQKGHP